jgi:hypothetical protein
MTSESKGPSKPKARLRQRSAEGKDHSNAISQHKAQPIKHHTNNKAHRGAINISIRTLPNPKVWTIRKQTVSRDNASSNMTNISTLKTRPTFLKIFFLSPIKKSQSTEMHCALKCFHCFVFCHFVSTVFWHFVSTGLLTKYWHPKRILINLQSVGTC